MLQYSSYDTNRIYIFYSTEERTQDEFESALEKAIGNTYEKVLKEARKEKQVVTNACLIEGALAKMAKYGFNYFEPVMKKIYSSFDLIGYSDEEYFLETARGITALKAVAKHNNKY
jgi:hypothetical protein